MAQPRMHWTLSGNLAETLATLEAAAAAGAVACVCTELAVTGFHRQLPALVDAAALADAEVQLRAACARLGLAAAVGLPTLRPDGAVLNSHLYINADGCEVGRVHKRGLTPSEATFFTPGATRGWTRLAGAWVTSVLCREMLDGATLVPALAAAAPAGDDPRLILWPGYIGASDTAAAADCAAYVAGARDLAVALGAWVLQSNWPAGLNAPAARGFGGSVVIDPTGRVTHRLPMDDVALSVVDVGSRAGQWPAPEPVTASSSP